jgi:hypothetical protein
MEKLFLNVVATIPHSEEFLFLRWEEDCSFLQVCLSFLLRNLKLGLGFGFDLFSFGPIVFILGHVVLGSASTSANTDAFSFFRNHC